MKKYNIGMETDSLYLLWNLSSLSFSSSAWKHYVSTVNLALFKVISSSLEQTVFVCWYECLSSVV